MRQQRQIDRRQRSRTRSNLGEFTYHLAGKFRVSLQSPRGVAPDLVRFCSRARAAIGGEIVPTRVAFSHPAPRSHGGLVESLGTRNIDFGAPVTTLIFRASDLEVPFPRADPVLACVLRRYALTLPPPRPLTWREQFHRALDEAIAAGEPSLQVLARKISVSKRTLRRQLAEHGTMWPAELDATRRSMARQASPQGTSSLARRLAYSEERSLRRAVHRWKSGEQRG